jgi:hypothetical protein
MKTHRTESERVSEFGETDKQGMADRYCVSLRTIENWLEREIIIGRKEHGKVVLDIADCDRRLLGFEKSETEADLSPK